MTDPAQDAKKAGGFLSDEQLGSRWLRFHSVELLTLEEALGDLPTSNPAAVRMHNEILDELKARKVMFGRRGKR